MTFENGGNFWRYKIEGNDKMTYLVIENDQNVMFINNFLA